MRVSLAFVAIALPFVLCGPKEEGAKFLAENKGKPGVITLPSGLQYKVLKKGTGTGHPTADSPCECHYKGTLINGEKFDSSYDRGEPTTFAPNQGWTEAMQLMVEGDKWEMYIPYDLAYGPTGSGAKIPGYSTLIFEMEIMKIKGSTTPALSCVPKTGEGCDEKEKAYIAKQSALSAADLVAEKTRLGGLRAGRMKKEHQQWLAKRLHILSQMVEDKDTDM